MTKELTLSMESSANTKGVNKEELEQTVHRALLMFVAQAKTMNESYTHFLGRFKHSEKQAFNNLVSASNMFCKTIKNNLPQESIDAADKLEEYMQDFMFTLIKNGEFMRDDNHNVKKKLNEMLLEPERLEYDIYSLNHVLKLIDKSNA